MVPVGRFTDKLQDRVAQVRALRRPMAWGLLLWAVVVAVPYALIFPEHGLSRPVVMVLAVLPPIGMFVAAMAGQPQLLLGVGLGAHLPMLVASPQLLASRTAGAVQGVTVAVLVLLFVATSFDMVRTVREQTVRVPVQGRLRRLLRWPEQRSGQAAVLLGALWLVIAWWVDAGANTSGASATGANAIQTFSTTKLEALRTTRVAAVALCWMAVQMVPLSRPVSATGPRDTVTSLLLRRAVWFSLMAAGWLWLNAVPEGQL
jgi:hypothetical protein